MYLYCDQEIEKALLQVQNRRLGLSSAEQHILLPSASCSPSNHQHAQRLPLHCAVKPNSYLFSISSPVLSWGKNTSYSSFSLVNKCLKCHNFICWQLCQFMQVKFPFCFYLSTQNLAYVSSVLWYLFYMSLLKIPKNCSPAFDYLRNLASLLSNSVNLLLLSYTNAVI